MTAETSPTDTYEGELLFCGWEADMPDELRALFPEGAK